MGCQGADQPILKKGCFSRPFFLCLYLTGVDNTETSFLMHWGWGHFGNSLRERVGVFNSGAQNLQDSRVEGNPGEALLHGCLRPIPGILCPLFFIVEKTVEKLFVGGCDFIKQSINFTVVFDHPFNFVEQMIFSEPIWNGDLFCLREKKTILTN